MTKFYDTSALLDGFPSIMSAPVPFLISLMTLQELEHIKDNNSKNEDVKYKARKLLVSLHANPTLYTVVHSGEAQNYLNAREWPQTHDNQIMAEACRYQIDNDTRIMFVTSDLSCFFLAEHQFKLAACLFIPNKGVSDYTGYLRLKLSNEELAAFYTETGTVSPKKVNSFSALTNQYLMLENENGTVVDLYRWDGEEYKPLVYETIKNSYMGIITPANLEQKLAFDLMQNEDITIKILTGGYGTGKDYVMMSHALHLLKQEKVSKVVWIRNGVKVKNAADIGLLPGTAMEKMMPYAMPMADLLGGKDNLMRLIEEEKIELENLGALRGRSWDDTIIYCSEAENFTKEHVQLLIGRVGKRTQLWINGDYRQVDGKVFETNNGLMTAINRLKGRELFGHVKLHKIERSPTASLADLLD